MKMNETEELTPAIRLSWCRDTSSTPSEWSLDNPARGQCVATVLVVQDYLGGDLEKLVTLYHDKEESHYRNVLPNGDIYDITSIQYPSGQVLIASQVILNGFKSIREKRLNDLATFNRYSLLSSRVKDQL